MIRALELEAVAGIIEAGRTDVPVYVPPNTQVLVGMGPLGGGKARLIDWIMRFAGLAYVLGEMGVPQAAKDILTAGGETLGIDVITAKFGGLLKDVEVAVYFRKRLIGRMSLASWKEFEGSMRRSVRDNFKVR